MELRSQRDLQKLLRELSTMTMPAPPTEFQRAAQ
jgi:hypothetical protein